MNIILAYRHFLLYWYQKLKKTCIKGRKMTVCQSQTTFNNQYSFLSSPLKNDMKNILACLIQSQQVYIGCQVACHPRQDSAVELLLILNCSTNAFRNESSCQFAGIVCCLQFNSILISISIFDSFFHFHFPFCNSCFHSM